MSSVVRADESMHKGHRFLVVKFVKGEAHLHDGLEHYELLRYRFDQLAIANNHPELRVSMAELKWRRFVLTLAIGVPVVIGVIAASIWYLNS